MKTTFLLFVSFLFFQKIIVAQDIPTTSICIMDVELNVNTHEYSFTNKKIITDWRGYNNQPFFKPDGTGIYFVCIKEDKQADIYFYDLISKAISQITHTPKWKEYSPQLTPDGKQITVVRVEEDDSTQHLWQYNLDGTPDKMITTANPVGYYCCYDSSRYALFVLGKTMSLQLCGTAEKNITKADDNIGRCLLPFKNNPTSTGFMYVNKTVGSDSLFQLITFDKKGSKNVVAKMPYGCEDFCVGMNEKIWYGKNGTLFELNNGDATAIADFNKSLIEKFYRLTYFPITKTEGKLAVVIYDGKKP